MRASCVSGKKPAPASAGDVSDTAPILSQDDPLEEETATLSILAWDIPQ